MKITIVADVFGEANNGTTVTIKRLIKGLVSRGHQIKIVSPLSAKSDDNIQYFTVPKRSFGIFNTYVAKNGVELGLPDKEIIKEAISGSDVVHIVLPFKMGKMAVKVCKELDIPFTTAFHCQPENFSSHLGLKNSALFNKLLYAYYKNTFYKYAKYIHCPTEFIARELNKNRYKAKKFAISNGVVSDFKKFKVEKPDAMKDRFVVLFVARMSKEKRHDLLIKASIYSKYADKLQLVFAGRGPLENKLKRLGRGLQNKIIIGFYPKEELAEIINYADLYVHPSDVEIEAISCIEAMTCGLVPVISDSKKSATRFFARHRNSLFDAGNYKSLAEKIDYWIEHQEEKKRVSDEYVVYAEQFNIERSIDKMVSMFEEAINDHKLLKKEGASGGKYKFAKQI